MASHKQSFQCFDAITDDPSLKPPLPHGHYSSASFRGSSGSTRLEPLEDHGCYLCADHQQAKALASEASGAYSNPWYHFQTHPHSQQYTIRRPTRTEEAPGQVDDHHLHHHHHHRHSRKIVLVKNSDPSVRRTIILHRRSLRSLALFMDEVSELMQCLIRKLYTLEGHKIDSVQSLLQCPSILVCVGREPFHPLLLDSFRKNSYDKLPRLNTKSRSSVCSDEKGVKKNVNFGLETKRSAINPMCDSSNRSARLSTSSEKLFPSGLNSLPPGHRGACPHPGENTMDDDIEKRVLVNKDGSLSMEMKVRFRLLHNETLHWSTEVKKSKSSFNEAHIVPDDACSLSHGSAESCSEADSLSAGEADETYSTKHYQKHFEEPHCQHCCSQCQEYDIWKNPVPPDQGSVRRIRSSSSSASSRRIVCKKASTDSMRTMSSEEYTEHVVEKATCIQQTFGQQGDTTIEKCTINHCHSRSEVRSVSPKTKSTSAVEDKFENTHVSENDRPDVISSNLPKDQLSVQITQPVEEEERPVSVVSASSQILASLKEDQDDEDVDLPVSISRTSQEDEESKDAEPNACSTTPCKSPASLAHLSPRPPSKTSPLGRSKRSKKLVSPEVDDEEGRSEASASPKALSEPKVCKCVVTKDTAIPGASESNEKLEDIQLQTDVEDEKEERALSAMSAKSKTSVKSLSELSASNESENADECTGVNGEMIEERSSSAISIKSNISGKSNVSEVLEKDGRAPSAMSIKSQKSDKSRKNEIADNVSEEQISEVRTSSAMSVKSNTSLRSKTSDNGFDELATLQDNVEERAESAVSSKSNISATSSRSKEPQSIPNEASEEKIEEKASSVKSGTSNKSGIKEVANDDHILERAPSSISMKSNISARSKMSIELSELEDQDRAPSSISVISNVSHKSKSDISEAASFHEGDESANSVKLNTSEADEDPQVELAGERSPSSVSSKSNISTRSRTSRSVEADQDEVQEKEDVQERASSAISVKSATSARSRKSETTPKLGEEMKERASSVMSTKSNASLKSNKSKMEEEEIANRASSALSAKSEVSTSSRKSNQTDVEQMEGRPSSPISAKSKVSVRSKGSKMSEVPGDDDQSSVAASHTSETLNECSTTPGETCKSTQKTPDKEERASSALSTKSNNSAKSKKSKISDMADDIVSDDLRSASAMSSKSNVSAKSVKSGVSELVTEGPVEALDQTEEQAQRALSSQSNHSGVRISDGVEVAEERALSAMSSKSNASQRSKKSNNLKVPTALPQAANHQTEEQAHSALPARSSISKRSSEAKISDVLTDEFVDVKDQEEERASSVLSAKSSISAKSKKSKASATDVKADDKENAERVPSAMSGRSDISTKTSLSAKSKVSNVSEVPPEELDNEESEVKALSIPKSSISVRSNKSKHSELGVEEELQNIERPPSAISVISDGTPEENENTNDSEFQERAPSGVSAKSSISAKSKKSKASATDVKADDKENGDRVPSAMSGRSDISTKTSVSAKSKASKVSELPTEDHDDEESEVKAPSITKSSISVRSNKSKHSELGAEEEVQNIQRPPSAISVISDGTPEENENTNDSEIQERAPSVLSSKSSISAKSKKSKASATDIKADDKENGDRVPSAMSGRSDISTKTSVSAKSKASKVSELPREDHDDEESEVKAPSITKSSISVRSNKSKHSEFGAEEEVQNIQRPPSAISVISDATPEENENTNDSEIQERAPSVLSSKSSISAKSKKSKASATDVKADDKENGDRVPSAMSGRSDISTKTSVSAKSKASKVSELPTEDHDDEESEVKAPSITKSSISVRSNKSKHSELGAEEEVQNIQRPPSAISVISDGTPEENENTNDSEIQERAPSVLSSKSSISAKSKKSKAFATDIKADDKENGDRVPSAMSGRSDISTKTSVSAKSKASKVSELPREDHDDEESEVKAPSITKSSISVRSNKSKHSELGAEEEVQNIQRPPSAISVISDATPEENENTNDSEIQERAPSGVSAKSCSSVRSRTSKVSEIIIDEPNNQKVERAPSSRSLKSDASGRSGPDDPVNEEKEARTESALSSISARSNKSENSEIISSVKQRAPSTASVTSKTSARSKRSNISVVAPKEIGNTDTGDGRASSAMSAKSCVSEKSKCSERTAVEDEEVNKVVDRTTSSLSVKSNQSITSDATGKSSIVPAKSNASAISHLSEVEEPDRRSTSVVSNASAETKTSKANHSPSKLSVKSNVSTRSKKSKVSEGEDHACTNTEDVELNRDESPLSDQSKVSHRENSNECICGAINKPSSPVASSEKDFDLEEVPASPLSKKSAKSKISSVGSTSERALTPTSTSVSIGIVEDHEADDVEEIDGGAVSVNSRTSSKTEICGKSDQCLSESPVQITNEATPTPEERPISSSSAKSDVSGKSKSKSSHCGSACPIDTIQDRDDVASNKYLTDSHPSANSSMKQSSQTQEIRPSSNVSSWSVHTEITGQEKAESPDVTHKPQSVCSKFSSTKQKEKTSPASSASAISDSGKSKTKEENTAGVTNRPKSNKSRSSSHLKVNVQKNDVEAGVNERSNKLNTRKSTQKVEDNAPRCHSAPLSFTSGNQLSPCPPKSPKKSKKPVILLGSSNDSVLSQIVPAPEPREEYTDHLKAAAEKPQSCRSETNVSEVKSEKSSKCRKRIGSNTSCNKMDDDMSDLSPSCLPNASPTEVVNEWLRKIPSDTTLCDLVDEFHDNYDLIEPLCTSHVPSGDDNEHESLQPSDVTKLETQNEMEDAHVVNTEGSTEKKTPEVAQGDRSQRGDGPKMFDSSVLVMKVLLSPKLDRCNSLPEVSPVYGRKLSASAQGLLDCLANLQLLDFGPSDEDGKKEKYQELMSMLKSLWLCDPKESEKTSEERNKCLDEEFKARSSSGVDVNSGSTGSVKSNVNDGTQAQINTECEVLDTLTKIQEVDETVEGEASETPQSKYDSATPEIANRAQLTPETKDTVEGKLKDDVPGSEETIRSNDSPRELIETPLSSNKSSENNPKKEETESDRQEDTSSGSAPKQPRGQLSKKLSQDPDPVWVLNLLNKLEKQFMTHYVNAMAEFKVRWDLDDNEQLDAMICELQHEVRKRIQSSIDRELRKIQGRAGRPRPPKETMSRESTIQTEQRRRRLKVMRNQSVDPQPAKSDDDYTMTGTDFSDQRSDDEYCPCDTCLKKKMTSKHVLPAEMLNSAPVMMDFDLRRILQMKKSPPTDEKIEETANKQDGRMEGDDAGLEAVLEENEKEGADKEILAFCAQEIEYEKQESEDGEEEDSASSSYVEDSSEKQSNIPRQLEKDVDKVGEIAEMTTTQDEEQEDNIESDSDSVAVKESASSYKMNKLDVANDDISELDDLMQTEAKEEASEEHTEEESEEQDKTADDETAEEGQTAKTEYVVEGETKDTLEDGQIAEAVAAGEEGETAEGETAEVGQVAEAKTLRDGETAEVETAEEGETVEDEASEDGRTAEAKITAENRQTSEDETAEEGESVNDEIGEEHAITENETAEDGQTAEDETEEEGESVNDDFGEENATIDNETAEGGQTAEDETGDEGETVNEDTAEEHEMAKSQTAEDGQTAEDETGESETVNEDTAEEHEKAKSKTAEGEQTAEDETEEEGESVNDNFGEENATTENETAEGGQTAEDETGDEGETVNEDTAEEHEMAKSETAEDGQTAEDETGDEGETVNEDTAEEHEMAKSETAEDGQTAEDETGESETVNEDTAEEHEKAKSKTAEGEQTAEDETEEEGESVNDNFGEENATTENETAEGGQTAEDETGDEGETVNEDTAEEHEMAKSKTAEDGQTAEDETGEEGETVNEDTEEGHETTGSETAEGGQTAEDETAEDGETDEDKSAEEGETTEDRTSEDGRTAEAETIGEDEITEDETGGEGETSAKNESVEEEETAETEAVEDSNIEGETAVDNTVEEHEMAENESVEDGQDETVRESDTEDGDTAKESEIAEDEKAENAQSSEVEAAEDEQNAEADSGERDTSDNGAVDDERTAEESETAEDETEAEKDTAEGTSVERVTDVQRTNEDEDNTDDSGTAEGMSAEEKETSEAETADEGTTEAEVSEEKAAVEDSNVAEDKNAVVELSEQTSETAGDETDKSHSNNDEDKETVSCEAAENEDVLSNTEDTESHDVLTNVEVIEDETPLKNNGDIVLDSVDDKGEESGKEDDDVEIMANKPGHVANTGESAEAGDEAEDDTEPDMETDEGEHNRNTLALQPLSQPKPKDDKPDGTASFNVLVKHNSESEDGADADVEDSETEVIDLSSESENKPQRKTALKTLKTLIYTLKFLSAAGQSKRKEEDNEHVVEAEETPEDRSDDAEESSCVEKDEVEENQKEKSKLSDITEDTAEDETNETNDYSEDHEWESSEHSLQKQITKSSLESQPGSFDEVLEEQAKNQKGLNHLKANR